MNQQRLDELKQRAERATDIKRSIDAIDTTLLLADKCNRVDFYTQQSGVMMSDKAVVKAALASLPVARAELEAELESLLGAEPTHYQEADHE